MNITTISKIIICIGILQTCSLYHVGAVDWIHFKVPEMVEWSAAEATCHKNNGKLFKPNETSFDVFLFSESNFNDDVWVAANYINITDVGSASRGDSFFRCEMCKTEGSCGTTCLYKACGDRCKVACVPLREPYNYILSDSPSNWTEANIWCKQHVSELGDKINNTSIFPPIGYCHDGCFWTKHMIQVQLENEIDEVMFLVAHRYMQKVLAAEEENTTSGERENGILLIGHLFYVLLWIPKYWL